VPDAGEPDGVDLSRQPHRLLGMCADAEALGHHEDLPEPAIAEEVAVRVLDPPRHEYADASDEHEVADDDGPIERRKVERGHAGRIVTGYRSGQKAGPPNGDPALWHKRVRRRGSSPPARDLR